jgi:diguanylate cyclase (GGDEF)-like protein
VPEIQVGALGADDRAVSATSAPSRTPAVPSGGASPWPEPAAEAEVVDLASVRRIAIVMYCGAIFGLLCAIFGPDPDPSDHAAFAAIIASAVVAIAVLAALRTLTLPVLRASCLATAVLTCVCVAVARPTNGVPLYTMWPMLLGAYALARRDFLVLLGVTQIALAVAIGFFVDPPARLNLWLDTVLTVTWTALVVRYLRENLDALVADLKEVARRVHEIARRDPLTGLPNRRAFDEALERELARAQASDRPLTVVLFDLDHFKQVNDRHGHAQGDASLRLIADIAHDELRPGDLLARIGGEEFALSLFDTDAATAGGIAERIVGRVRGATAGGAVPLSASAGVAQCMAASSAHAVLRRADRALYAAKAAGRGRVAAHDGAVRVGGEVPAAAPAGGRDGAGTRAVPHATAADLEPRWRDDERPQMRRVAALLCAAAVPAMAACVLLPGAFARHLVVIAALCGLLAAQSAALLIAKRTPIRVLRLLPFVGVLTITAAVAVNDPISGTPFFFVWPAVYSAYFFGRRHLTVVLGTMCVAYGVALALWVDAPLRTSDFTTVLVPVAVTGLAVASLRDRMRRLVEELRRNLADLQKAASHDPLTGVLNRRAFETVFARELDRARLSGLDLALAIFDLDHFKDINDALGHAAGDAALAVVAGVLADGVRPGDLVARIGGEEFAVLLLDADAAFAADVADEVAVRLAERTSSRGVAVSVSAGTAELGGELQTTGALLVAADRALYAAKSAGRSRTAVWGDPIDVREPGAERAPRAA